MKDRNLMGKKSHSPTGPSLTSETLSTETPGFSAFLIVVERNSGCKCGGKDEVGEQIGGGGGLSSSLASAHTLSCTTGACP